MKKADATDEVADLRRQLDEANQTIEQLKKSSYLSEDLHHTDQSNLKFGYWEWSNESKLGFKSPAFVRMLGYNPDEVSADFWSDHIFNDDLKSLKKQFNKYLDTIVKHPFELSLRFTHKDGHTVPIDVHGKVIRWTDDNQPAYAVGGLVDVSELHQSRAKYQEIFERMEIIVEGIDAGIWDWDMKADTSWWSNRFYKLLGFDPGEIDPSNDHFMERIAEGDRKEVERLIEEHLIDKKPYRAEFRVRGKDGKLHWVAGVGKAVFDDLDQPLRMAGSLMNIDNRKGLEMKLLDQLELFKVAEEIARMGAWEYYPETQDIVYSDQVFEIFGRSWEENPNLENSLTYYKEESKKKAMAALEKAVEDKEPYEVELEMITPAGKELWLRVKGVPVVGDSGKVERIMGIVQDIDRQKRQELELQEQKLLLAEASHIACIGAWSIDLATETTLWSDEVYEIHEVSREYQIQASLEFYHPENQEEIVQGLTKTVETGEDFSTEAKIVTARNNEKWVKIVAKAVTNADGIVTHIRGFIQDIHEAKLKEIQLQDYQNLITRQNALFRETEKAGGIGSWEYNIETNELYWSEEFFRIHDVSADYSPTAEKAWEFVDPEFRKPLQDAFNETVATGVPYEMQVQITTATGVRKWVIAKGMPVEGESKMRGLYLDISELKEKKEALRRYNRELEKRQQLLTQAGKMVKMGYWEWNQITGEVTWSDQLYSIFEADYSFEPNEEHSFSYIYSPEDAQAINEAAERARSTGEHFDMQVLVTTLKGNKKWVLVQGAPLRDQKGELIGTFGTIQDIDQIKRKELELQKTTHIIGEQNQRLKNFTHIVSHNLRSHSSNIQTMLDFMDRAPNEDPETVISYIRETANSMEETLGHLHEVIKIQNQTTPKMRTVNLQKELDKTLNVLEGEIVNHQVSFEFDLQVITLKYTRAYLDSILLNLISNAIKYRQPGRAPLIKIRTYSDEGTGKTVLEIEDNGRGMNLKKQGHKLFGLYKTFHRHPDSRGIGLFIVKSQVEAMGGIIEAESKEGVGTTFRIFF